MPKLPDLDIVIAQDPTSARSLLHTADVIETNAATRSAAREWCARTLANYPGCLLAVALCPDQQWCLLATRDRAPLLATGRNQPLSRPTIDQLIRTVYRALVLPDNESTAPEALT